MKQRIEIRSIIKKDGRILLLKRSQGSGDRAGKYELPGGRVVMNEQPEDANKRLVKEATGLDVHSAYLGDVFTYVGQGDKAIQSAIIIYVASVSGNRGDVQTDGAHSRYIWRKIDDVASEEVTELTLTILNTHRGSPGVTKAMDGHKIESSVSYVTQKPRGEMTIYSDGGSRGNPGPSAAGYIIKDSQDSLIYEGGAYLGITTNNQAEYHGARLGLEKAREIGAKTVDCYIDSMLVVNQLNGQYVIRNRELWPIHERIVELISQFEKVTFRHVKREFNQQADAMVNKILDARHKGETIKL